MAGQAFSAHTEPNYRYWILGGLFALGLIGSLWYACRTPEKPSPPKEAAVLDELGSNPQEGKSRQELKDELRFANSKLHDVLVTLEAARGKIGRMSEQMAGFRREREARGEYFPPLMPDVHHVGGIIYKRADGGVWVVEGVFFNLGEVKADGFAELQLYADGRPVGEGHKTRIGPIDSGGQFQYQASLPRAAGDEATRNIFFRAVWMPM